MKVLVCGDREWSNRELIKSRLSGLLDREKPGDITVIHGACRGADRIAGEVAKELGMQVEEHPADWRRHAKWAGPKRNRDREMLDREPDLVLAFHNYLERSKGTIDTIREAKRRGINVHVVSRESPS